MGEMNYLLPGSTDEALALASEQSVFSSGGTDLQLRRQQRLVHADTIIDLSRIPGLDYLRVQDDGLELGARVTLHDLAASEAIKEGWPILAQAAASVATPVIRRTATLGGNLLVANRCTYFNQSHAWRASAGFCLRDGGATCLATKGKNHCFSRHVSDVAPALIALGVRATVVFPEGPREMALEELYRPDGIAFHLEGRWILTSIRVPGRPLGGFFRKLRQRESLDFTSLTVAAARGTSLRVCIGGMSMSPVLVEDPSGPDDLRSRVRALCRPVDNDLMPVKYRRTMLDAWLGEVWEVLGPES